MNFLIVWLIMGSSVIFAQDEMELEMDRENEIVKKMLLRSVRNFANKIIEM